jgi:hypothetical protein
MANTRSSPLDAVPLAGFIGRSRGYRPKLWFN